MNDGKLVFGSTNGLVVLHPDSINKTSSNPQTVISSISINNKQYKTETLTEYLEEISYSYSQKVISFTFRKASVKSLIVEIGNC